jgi:hypothetical protein
MKHERIIHPISAQQQAAAAAMGISQSLFQRLEKEGHITPPVQVPGSSVKLYEFQTLIDDLRRWREGQQEVNEWDEAREL